MDPRTAAVAGGASHAFSVWMPLDSFAPVTFAAAATAAGPSAVRSVVCGALAPRDRATTSPEFYAVIASILRSPSSGGFEALSFDVTEVHVVSPRHAEDSNKSLFESLMGCLREDSLFAFEADYIVGGDVAGEALTARTCALIQRHRHTLRRLKVPGLRQYDAPGIADALAECTAITSLDLSFTRFPFRSWQHLGPTLHTLKLTELSGRAHTATFRLLADNMPALRELQLYVTHQPSQDGFIELVSRLGGSGPSRYRGRVSARHEGD
jgi:hypothetical protein